MPHTNPSSPARAPQAGSAQAIPLNVLQHVLQTSVGLMEVAGEMSVQRESLRIGEKERRSQLLTFSALDKRLDAALKIPTQATEELRLVIGRISKAGRRELELALDDLNTTRDGREEEYRKQVEAQCYALVGTLLGRQTLPRSRTDLAWSARGGNLDAQLVTHLNRV